MWDRFPPRMRKAITVTLEEAGRRGLGEASTEDVLLAITKDPECAAVFMFEHAGVPLHRLRDRLNGSGPHEPDGSPVAQAKKLSETAIGVLSAAVREADRLNHRHVGTEHVALAFARSDASGAADVLKSLGFTSDRAETAMRAWVAQGMPRRRMIHMPGWLARMPLGTWLARIPRAPAMLWAIFARKSLGHPRFVTDPYPLYRKLRETEPVRKDPLAPVWVITTYAETHAMLRDPRFRKDPFA
jgi:hypothetical protein